jgi:hypothetical protein
MTLFLVGGAMGSLDDLVAAFEALIAEYERARIILLAERERIIQSRDELNGRLGYTEHYGIRHALSAATVAADKVGQADADLLAAISAARKHVAALCVDVASSQTSSQQGKNRIAGQEMSRSEQRKLGGLAAFADESATEMVRRRGGGASQVNHLASDYRQMSLRDLAHRAVQGDREAERAIKMVKQAGSQGKGGK